jgi:hypothetical protein
MNETTRLAIQETIDSLIDGLKNKPMETMITLFGRLGEDGRNEMNLHFCDEIRQFYGDASEAIANKWEIGRCLLNLICNTIKEERNLIVPPDDVLLYIEHKELEEIECHIDRGY